MLGICDKHCTQEKESWVIAFESVKAITVKKRALTIPELKGFNAGPMPKQNVIKQNYGDIKNTVKVLLLFNQLLVCSVPTRIFLYSYSTLIQQTANK